MRENSLFDNFTDWIEGANIFQSTFRTMENQGNSLNNMEKMKFDEHRIVTIQNLSFTNKFFILKLRENSLIW